MVGIGDSSGHDRPYRPGRNKLRMVMLSLGSTYSAPLESATGSSRILGPSRRERPHGCAGQGH